MSLNIPPELQPALLASQCLQKAGFESYLVGGIVRDILLGRLDRKNIDLDICTNAGSEDLAKIFPHVKNVGKSFGVCVVEAFGAVIDIATYRKDGPYSDNRHPDFVELGTKEEDAKRRDFTINSIYWNLVTNELWDPNEGKKDLKAMTLRCIGEPRERFLEDPLRILRLFRFKSDLGLDIEQQTLQAAVEFIPLIKKISKERIFMEWSKCKNYESFLKEIENLNIGDILFDSKDHYSWNTKIDNQFKIKYPALALAILTNTLSDMHAHWPITKDDKKNIEALKKLLLTDKITDIKDRILIITRLLEHFPLTISEIRQIFITKTIQEYLLKFSCKTEDSICNILKKIAITNVVHENQKLTSVYRSVMKATRLGYHLPVTEDWLLEFKEKEQRFLKSGLYE